MKGLRLAIIVGVVMLSASYGCKKDEPAANEGNAKAVEKTATENASEKSTSVEPGAEPAKAPAAEPAKAPAADAPKAKAATANVPKAAAAKTQAPAAVAPKMPSNLLGYVAITGFDSVFKLVTDQAKKFGTPLPPQVNADLLLLQASGVLGLSSMDWFDRKRPLAVFGPNPKESQSAIISLPIKDKASVLAALPASAKKDDQGNAASLSVMGQTGYINFVKGYLVIAQSPTLFAGKAAFIESTLNNLKLDALIVGNLSVENVRTAFTTELKAGMAELKNARAEIVKELAREIPDVGAATSIEGLVDFGIKAVEAIATESMATRFSANYANDGTFSVPLTLALKADGKLGKFAAKSTTGKNLSFAANAPKSAWLLFGGRIDPKLFSGLTYLGINSLKSTLKMSDEDVATVTKQFKALVDLQDGSQWISLYADGKFPVAVLSAAGLTNGKEYKATLDAYMGLLFKNMMTLVKDILPPNLQAIQGQTFTQIVATLNGITKNMGVTLEASDATQGDVAVQSVTITVDPATLERVSGSNEATVFLNILGTKLAFAMATGPKAISFAMGPNAVASATQVAGGTYNGGSEIAKNLKPNVNAFINVDVSSAVNAFRPIVAKADPTVKIPAIPAGVDFGVTAGSTPTSLSLEFFGNVDAIIQIGLASFSKFQKSALEAPTPAVPTKPVAPTAPPTTGK